jgi:hypothetical protein
MPCATDCRPAAFFSKMSPARASKPSSPSTSSLQPADGVEFGFVEEMVASFWRLRRAWALETHMIEKQVAAQPPGTPWTA